MSRPSCTRRFRASLTTSPLIQPNLTRVRRGSRAGQRSGAAVSGDPDAVFLHDLAVELDAPTETEVLDDVPVDRRDVRAADVVEAVAERKVDGSFHLLVEVDVPHVAV